LLKYITHPLPLTFFIHCSRDHRDLHSFPTRRSSDLTSPRPETREDAAHAKEIVEQLRNGIAKYKDYHVALADGYKIFHCGAVPRSEEHTSELQSRGHLVCRLLLEKKKIKYMMPANST